MDRDLHNIDNIFNSAYQQYEENPSGTSWGKVNAMLDKEDAERYKKRFIGWKRAAILVSVLLGGLVIYEAGIFNIKARVVTLTEKKGKGTAGNKNSSKVGIKNSSRIKQQERTKANASVNEINLVNKNQSNESATTVLKQTHAVVWDDRLVYSVNANSTERKSGKTKTTHQKRTLAARDQIIQIYPENITITSENTNPKHLDVRNGNATSIIDNLISGSINSRPMAGLVRIAKPAMPFSFNLSQFAMPIHLAFTKGIANEFKEIQKPAKDFKPFWTVSMFASNNIGRYMLDNDVADNNGSQINEKEAIIKRERNEPSFSGGLFATRQLTKHVGVKTGLIYANTAITIDPQLMYASKASDGQVAFKYITSSGYGYVRPDFGLPPAVGDSIQSNVAQHNLQSISIPIMATYKLVLGKCAVSPSAGIAANFITGTKIKTEVKDAMNKETININRLQGMRNFYLALAGDINLQYQFNNKLAVNFMPAINYAISPITKSNAVTTYPYSFGIGAGLTIKL